MPQKCPTCGLLCADTAERCDCGYDFSTRTASPPKPASGTRGDLLLGVLLFLAAYGVQLLDIAVRSPILPLLSLALYAVSFLYLIRALVRWIKRKKQ